MQLETLLFIGALLACPIGMGAMMWMMSRNMGGHHAPAATDSPEVDQMAEERLVMLRTQRQALEAEIAEVKQLAELEAQREVLRQEAAPVVNKTTPNHNTI